jgi:hypothetical protein
MSKQSIDSIPDAEPLQNHVQIIALGDISDRVFLRWVAGLRTQEFQGETADEASHLEETSVSLSRKSYFHGSCSHSSSPSGETYTLFETCSSTLIYHYGSDESEIEPENYADLTGFSTPLTGSEFFRSGYDGSESEDTSVDVADELGLEYKGSEIAGNEGCMNCIQCIEPPPQNQLETTCAHNINTLLIGHTISPDPEKDGLVSNSNPETNVDNPNLQRPCNDQDSPEFFDNYKIGFLAIHIFVGSSHNTDTTSDSAA